MGLVDDMPVHPALFKLVVSRRTQSKEIATNVREFSFPVPNVRRKKLI